MQLGMLQAWGACQHRLSGESLSSNCQVCFRLHGVPGLAMVGLPRLLL